MGTVAYHAERELDTLMYQDTGMYRNMQYGKANIISLQTMYEEIKILWDQELKYRPDFSVVDGVVNIPVIFAKVSSQRRTYRRLLDIRKRTGHGRYSRDKRAPYIEPMAPNPMKCMLLNFSKMENCSGIRSRHIQNTRMVSCGRIFRDDT